MGFIENELDEVKKLCEHCIEGSKLVTCVETMVRVEISTNKTKHFVVCFQFPDNYPGTSVLLELKSKYFSEQFLNKLTLVTEAECKKLIGKPQILKTLNFLTTFFEEHSLSICYDEIEKIRAVLSHKDELKLKQKSSCIWLQIAGNNYIWKSKLFIPPTYPDAAVSLSNIDSNFPALIRRYLVGHATEIARQCVEAPATRLVRASKINKGKAIKQCSPAKFDVNFKPSPSLEKVVVFLVESIRGLPLEKCQKCHKQCLPINPEDAERDESADKHVERMYCGHLFHLKCLIEYMKIPPFQGGKPCPGCGKQIYHDKWQLSEKLAEDRWAHQQARERELREVADFFD